MTLLTYLKPSLAALLVCVTGIRVSADTYRETLDKVVSASPALKAAAAGADAEKSENLTGMNLADPEVELSYQWGVPSDVPDKKTIDVSQEFDFATLSGAKKRLAKARNAGLDAGYVTAAREVRAQADGVMTDIVYQRRLMLHYDSAMRIMNRALEAAELGLSKGEMTVVDVNAVRMDLSALKAEQQLNKIECRSSLQSLSQIGGGMNIGWEGADYDTYSLPGDFDEWVAETAPRSAEVRAAQAAVNTADAEISLRKSENLPTFSVGYTSELVTDANYHGVTLGVQLPLWANAGRVKAARTARTAAQIAAENAAFEFERNQRLQYDKAVALRQLYAEARNIARECDIHDSLHKLLASGQISVHEYLSQLVTLLELNKKVIEAEYSYQKALADFRAAAYR